MMFGRKLYRTVYFYLMTAGLPVLLIHLALENDRLSVIVYAAAMFLALPLSILPGKLFGKVPFRVPVSFLTSAAVLVGTVFIAIAEGIFFLRGAFAGGIMAILLLFSMRDATLDYPQWTGTHGMSIGLILYLIAGAAAASLIEAPLLREVFWIEGLIFLGFSAYYLNNDNMLTGLATRKNAKPPKSLVTGNRILTVIFAAIAALVIFWSRLQDAAGRFALWFTQTVLILLYKLATLLSGDQGSSGGGGEQQNPAETFSDFGETEPSTFWVIMEKVLVVVAVVVGLALLFLFLRTLFRLILRVVRYLRDYWARFAAETGEDYEDEQIDLFDLDDLKEQTKQRLVKAVRKFTTRQKKWEDMDLRERVRFCIRQLYNRAGYSNGELKALTIREAVPMLPKVDMTGDELASLYEKARYSEEDPSEQEAAKLRKAVKP